MFFQDVGVLKGYIIEQQNRYRKKRVSLTCDFFFSQSKLLIIFMQNIVISKA